MKKIVDYLKIDTINLNLKSKDKKSVLKELFEGFSNLEEIKDSKKCFEDLIEREKMGSTGIGKEVAVPHAKTSGVKELVMTIGISREGIAYESIDETDAKIFFMFLSPVELSQEYLIILAKISRFIKEDSFRESLLNAKTKEEILEILTLKEA